MGRLGAVSEAACHRWDVTEALLWGDDVSDVLCKSLTLAAMEKQLGWHKSEAGRPFGTNFTLLRLAFLSIRGS